MKETGSKVARLAGRRLSGEIKKLTPAQELSVCASCVAQAEREAESARVWGIKDVRGRLVLETIRSKKFLAATFKDEANPDVVPVLVRFAPTRADKRTQARKLGK